MSVPVYVLNMRGQPLMPTTPSKARKLVKANKASYFLATTGQVKQDVIRKYVENQGRP